LVGTVPPKISEFWLGTNRFLSPTSFGTQQATPLNMMVPAMLMALLSGSEALVSSGAGLKP